GAHEAARDRQRPHKDRPLSHRGGRADRSAFPLAPARAALLEEPRAPPPDAGRGGRRREPRPRRRRAGVAGGRTARTGLWEGEVSRRGDRRDPKRSRAAAGERAPGCVTPLGEPSRGHSRAGLTAESRLFYLARTSG